MNRPAPELLELMLRTHGDFVCKLSMDDRLTALADAEPDEIRSVLKGVVDSVCDKAWPRAGLAPSPEQREWLAESVLDEAFGLGPLEPLLRDKSNDAIVIVSPSDVRVENAGELRETAVAFANEEHVLRTLERYPRLKPHLERMTGKSGRPSWRIDLGTLRMQLSEAGTTATA
jgi:hypothetical protein